MLFLNDFSLPLLVGIIHGALSGEFNALCRVNKCLRERNSPSVELCRGRLEKNSLLSTLNGLTGMGWDNLQNLPMSQVLNLTFDHCSTTPDGQFLVPDQMQIFPVKKINLDKMANYYEHWKDYFESKSETINVEGGFKFLHFGISGSYSSMSQETKEKFSSEKSSMLHTSLQYDAYSALLDTGAKLHSSFRSRLLSINEALHKNFTRQARYLAELLVRDYGTHVVMRAELGARIEQEDYVDSKVKESTETTFSEVRTAASASFFSVFSASASYTKNTSTKAKEHFEQSLKHSQIRTRGGPNVNKLLKSDPNGKESQLSIDDLVVLDRSGMPIFALLTKEMLPEMDESSIGEVRKVILEAIETYYRVNKIDGCMSAQAPNFDFYANVNSTCVAPVYNQTFGGTFQTCQIVAGEKGARYPRDFAPETRQKLCDPYLQMNGETGAFTCGDLYQTVSLLTIEYQMPDVNYEHCWKDCAFLGLFCDKECVRFVYKYLANVKTYYCRAKPDVTIPSETGFMFGGLYQDGQVNLFTGSASCPGRFQPYRLFRNTTACLSRNYAADGMYQVKLGGFFSCQTPTNEAKCPQGFTQHLSTVENGCDVMYCVKPEQLNRYLPIRIKRPPFEDPSALSNDFENTVYFYRNNTFWHKRRLVELIDEALERNYGNSLIFVEMGNDTAKATTITTEDFKAFLFEVYIPQHFKAQNGESLPPSDGTNQQDVSTVIPGTLPLNDLVQVNPTAPA